MTTPMSTVLAAINGGAPGIIAHAGGSLQVAMLLDGVEVSGNGYQRGVVTEFADAAEQLDGITGHALSAAYQLTATGSFQFDQLQWLGADGSTVVYTAPKRAAITVTPGVHNMRLVFNSAAALRRDSNNVRDLGCVPMHEDGGRTDATAAANAAALNAYLAGGWRDMDGLPLSFPAGGWLVADTIRVPAIAGGFGFIGVGGGTTLYNEGQHEAGDFEFVGPVSRIVGSAALAAAGKPIISFGGHAPWMRDIVVQGDWTADGNLYQMYPLPSGPDNRCAVGIEVLGSIGDRSSGKLQMHGNCSVIACKVGVDCSPLPNPNHADQLQFDRIYFGGCDVGLRMRNRQSMGTHIKYLALGKCAVGVDVAAGGLLDIDMLDMEEQCDLGVRISGHNAADANHVKGWVRIGRAHVDSSTPNESKLLDIAPTTGNLSIGVNIGYIHNDFGRTTAPLITVRNDFSQIDVQGGRNLFNGFIEHTGGVNQAFTTYWLSKLVFHPGHGPTGAVVVPETGSHRCQISHRECVENHNIGDAAANDGLIYEAAVLQIP